MSSSDRYPYRAGEPETQRLLGLITGAGAASPTVTSGCNGFTVTWVSTGLYTITFSDKPNYVYPDNPAFGATTATDVDGWTTVFHAYNATAGTIQMRVYSDTPTLSDLPANTWLNLKFDVKLTAAAG